MTPADAAKLLELPENVRADQIEARFNELRTRLEDKIAKAPTPGLKAKYRETLDEITVAFETLTLAADSSTLPVLQKQSAKSEAQSVGAAAPPQRDPEPENRKSRTKNQKSGKEFIIVALIAVVVLGAGGWWVVKTRAEKAEQARIAAEAERLAEARRQAAEAEKARLAAEKVRRTSQLRTELAAARVAWEALEKRLQAAERRTSEAKGEARSFRDGPAWKKAELSALAHRHELFSNWLNEYLADHPAKVARVTAEQLVSDGLLDEAATAIEQMKQEMQALQEFLAERAQAMLEGTAEVVVESKPAGVKFVFTDAYGRTMEGTTPATLTAQPLSHLHDPKFDGDEGDTEVALGEFSVEPSVRFIRPGWKDVLAHGRTSAGGARFSAEFAEGSLRVSSQPTGVPFEAVNALGWKASGQTPATLTAVPPGPVTIKLGRPGFREVSGAVEVAVGKTAALELDQRGQLVEVRVAEAKSKIFVDGKFAGYEKAVIQDLTPGEHALQIEANGYTPYRAKFTVRQEATRYTLSYSFKELAVENITCGNCKGAGKFPRQKTCEQCRGTRRIAHYYCDGRGWVGGSNGYPAVTCPGGCNGTGRVACDAGDCQDGRVYWDEYCTSCGGDGRVSKLQLSQ
jgi:hypothetical protein